MSLAPWPPKRGYLNTASFGIPPPAAVEAVAAVTADWANGRLSFGSWFSQTQLTRGAIAALLAVPPEWVSLGGSSAPLLGSRSRQACPTALGCWLPRTSTTRTLIPYLNQAHRGVTVEQVRLSELAARVTRDDDARLLQRRSIAHGRSGGSRQDQGCHRRKRRPFLSLTAARRADGCRCPAPLRT